MRGQIGFDVLRLANSIVIWKMPIRPDFVIEPILATWNHGQVSLNSSVMTRQSSDIQRAQMTWAEYMDTKP
jgi:hypothetical protein